MPKSSTLSSGRAAVDSYIASAPTAAKPMLRTLRSIVKDAVPQAEERLSYGMPYYNYHGRVVYFSAHKEHIGVYGLAGSGVVASDLQAYFAERGTLRFALDEPLPTEALRAAIRARARQNETGEPDRNDRSKKVSAARRRSAKAGPSKSTRSASNHERNAK